MGKILVIDDKMDNLISLSALLRNLMPDCAAVLARSGREGIEKAKAEQPDVILLDIKMPDMDGFETCQRLKKDKKTKYIPVIMVTAIKTDAESRIKGLDIGADAFISKPIEETELVSQVKVALRIKRAEDMLRKERDALEQVVGDRTLMLKESEGKYRAMMESITDQVYICSPNCTVEYMNPAMIRRLGRDATGETCHQVLHGLDSPCDWCVFDEVAKGKTIETTITSPLDGRTYRVTNMPVKHQDRMISKMSIYRDITQYLTVVAEKEKVQAQLLQAQKMESIGTLAGGIAHDFNNILYPIIGFTQMSIEDLPENHPVRENLEDILQGAKRARDLVKQILLFSSQKVLDPKPITIKPVIEEAIKLLRATLPSNIEIQQELNEEVGCILGDATEIHEVIMNLCTNAYHAMEETGGLLKVSLDKVTPDPKLNLPVQDHCCLFIKDTGTGIAPEIVQHIFEPYFTTKGLGKGSGLGLSVVHGIVKNYKGAITIDSQPNKGTAFYIYFPLISAAMQSEGTTLQNENGTGGNEHILFVDDEEPIVKIGTRILERLGYLVTGKTSSIEALELFKSNPDKFDLIITDMTMPMLLGTELAQKILEIRGDIPILICTGFSEQVDKETAASYGIKGYINKPILINELSSSVRDLLDRVKKG